MQKKLELVERHQDEHWLNPCLRALGVSKGTWHYWKRRYQERNDRDGRLSLRLIKEGYEVRRCNQAIMLHYASPKQRPSTRHTYYYYRNIHFQIWRNLPAVFAVKESLAVAVDGLCRTLFGGNLLSFCRGTLAALARLPRVIVRERRPLSLEQYRPYATLRGPDFKISRRVQRLVREALLASRQSRRRTKT